MHAPNVRRALRPALAALLLAVATTAGAAPISAAPRFFRMKLGDFTVIALSDGRLQLDTRKLLVDDRPGVASALLEKAGETPVVPTSVNAFLVDTGRKRILVDTGAGATLGPDLGRLQQSLRLAGYAPGQIDEVLLTHLHPDHCGGLADHGHAAFPNAIVRMDRREAAFWLDKTHAAAVPAPVRDTFDDAATALQPYIADGRLHPFAAGATLEPGVRAVALDGHTAGHSGYRFESRGQVLLVWGDIVHVGAVQFPDPRVTIRFDSAPANAEAARERVDAQLAAEHTWVAGAHLAFPGIGHVVRRGHGYAWRPVATAGH